MASSIGGYNESEKYLNSLCNRSFLSLWSYSNLFKQRGQELCDALVVVGNRVLIFSDKACQFKEDGSLDVNWARWFRSAIEKSANQLWGAKNWIERHRDRIFLDPNCTIKFPINLSGIESFEFHLIAVAHGASSVCQSLWGGSGSLIISNTVQGMLAHTTPCLIGDLDPTKTFIHVLDDISLDILMKNRDTINDLFDYLTKREALFRGGWSFWSNGEENLLAHYLVSVNAGGEHCFEYPNDEDRNNFLVFPDRWEDFESHPQRIAQLSADRISYFWDSLIEHFIKHSSIHDHGGSPNDVFNSHENAVRILAHETRFSRRVLSEIWLEASRSTPRGFKRIRTYKRFNMCYIFLFFPGPERFPHHTQEENRSARDYYLSAVCRVCKLLLPELTFSVGISIESGFDRVTISPSLLYYEYKDWSEDWVAVAKEEQQNLSILVNPASGSVSHKEYPEVS